MIWIAIVVCIISIIFIIIPYKHTKCTLVISVITMFMSLLFAIGIYSLDCIRTNYKNISFDTVYETSIKKIDVSVNTNGKIRNYIVTHENGSTKTIEPSNNTIIVFKHINKKSKNGNLENYKHLKISKKDIFLLSNFSTIKLMQYTFT